ncbi:MAG TPA: hypothetical protein VIN09_02795 [Chloroflexota bacterium]
MARERAVRPERLRVVRGRPSETPILDLAEGVRVYLDLMDQGRRLQAVMDELRERIVRAMERIGVDDFYADGVHAVRQIRRFPPQLDEARAAELLAREGLLDQAERRVLDPERARRLIDELYAEGRLRREELPYTPAREVEALVVRRIEEER